MTQEESRRRNKPNQRSDPDDPLQPHVGRSGRHTICYYDGRVKRNATHAYQLAKAVCFYSPWQFLYWYDRPSIIGDEPELESSTTCQPFGTTRRSFTARLVSTRRLPGEAATHGASAA